MKRLYLIVCLISLLSFPALAQQHKPEVKLREQRPEAKGDIFHPTNTQGDIATFISNLADISGAITLSTQIPDLQDPVGNACWQQFNGIGELIKAHPLPVNLKVASDWEALRLLAIGMNQICANPNCGQMFLDATNTVAAIQPIANGLSLQSICAKIPVIGTNAVPTSAIKPAGVGTIPAAPVAPPITPPKQ